MLRILHCLESIAHGSGEMHVVMNLYRAIDKHTIQFDFLVFKTLRDDFTQEILTMGGRVFVLPRPQLDPKVFSEYGAFFSMCSQEGIGILHNHCPNLAFFFIPIARRNHMVHFITHNHSAGFSENFWPAVRNRLLCLPLNTLSEYRFSCSLYAGKKIFGKSFGTEENDRVLKNAIDLSKYQFSSAMRSQYRKDLQIAEDEIAILHVGRLSPVKNHSFLLKVMSSLVRQNRHCKLFLVGDGPLRSQIEEEVKVLGLSCFVYFLGIRQDVNQLLSSMDYFILPSKFEGLPLSLVEAQASGLPCLISDCITEEAVLLGTTFKNSLKNPPSNWACKILDTSCNSSYTRSNCLNSLGFKGFDIGKEAKKLENFYLQIEDSHVIEVSKYQPQSGNATK
jgi:glycosyltransferase involved in cell wall biosynthesis